MPFYTAAAVLTLLAAGAIILATGGLGGLIAIPALASFSGLGGWVAGTAWPAVTGFFTGTLPAFAQTPAGAGILTAIGSILLTAITAFLARWRFAKTFSRLVSSSRTTKFPRGKRSRSNQHRGPSAPGAGHKTVPAHGVSAAPQAGIGSSTQPAAAPPPTTDDDAHSGQPSDATPSEAALNVSGTGHGTTPWRGPQASDAPPTAAVKCKAKQPKRKYTAKEVQEQLKINSKLIFVLDDKAPGDQLMFYMLESPKRLNRSPALSARGSRPAQ